MYDIVGARLVPQTATRAQPPSGNHAPTFIRYLGEGLPPKQIFKLTPELRVPAVAAQIMRREVPGFSSLQAVAQHFKMGQKFSFIDIELPGAWQGRLCHAFQFPQVHKAVLDEENNVIKVGIETAIQLAQGNAVRV